MKPEVLNSLNPKGDDPAAYRQARSTLTSVYIFPLVIGIWAFSQAVAFSGPGASFEVSLVYALFMYGFVYGYMWIAFVALAEILSTVFANALSNWITRSLLSILLFCVAVASGVVFLDRETFFKTGGIFSGQNAREVLVSILIVPIVYLLKKITLAVQLR